MKLLRRKSRWVPMAAALCVMFTAPVRAESLLEMYESARGYDLIDAHGVWPPSVEYGYLHSATLRADDPAFRSALTDVEARMQAGFGGQVEVRVSADRHSAIVVQTPYTLPASIRSAKPRRPTRW